MIAPIRGTPHKGTGVAGATDGGRAVLGTVQETRWPTLCLSVRGSGACVRAYVQLPAALPCSCYRLRCQFSWSVGRSVLLSSLCSKTGEVRLRRLRRGPVRRPAVGTREESECGAPIGRENRGIEWGDAIGGRGLGGAGTTPSGNSSRSGTHGSLYFQTCHLRLLLLRQSQTLSLHFGTGFA